MRELLNWRGLKWLIGYVAAASIVWYAAAIFGNQDFINDGANLTKEYLARLAQLPYIPDEWEERLREWWHEIPAHIEVINYNDDPSLALVWKIWMTTAVAVWLPYAFVIFPLFNSPRSAGGGARTNNPGDTNGGGGNGGNAHTRPATNEFDVEAIWAKVKGTLVLFWALLVPALFLGGWFFYQKFHSLWKHPELRDDVGFNVPTWSNGEALLIMVIVLVIPIYFSTKMARAIQVHGGGAWTMHHTAILAGSFFTIIAIEWYVATSLGMI